MVDCMNLFSSHPSLIRMLGWYHHRPVQRRYLSLNAPKERRPLFILVYVRRLLYSFSPCSSLSSCLESRSHVNATKSHVSFLHGLDDASQELAPDGLMIVFYIARSIIGSKATVGGCLNAWEDAATLTGQVYTSLYIGSSIAFTRLHHWS